MASGLKNCKSGKHQTPSQAKDLDTKLFFIIFFVQGLSF